MGRPSKKALTMCVTQEAPKEIILPDRFTISVGKLNWTFLLVESINNEKDDVITMGQTHGALGIVKIRQGLKREFLEKTVRREIAHVFMDSFALRESDNSYDEEKVCEIIATYGDEIIELSKHVVKKIIIRNYKLGGE